jgi:hypothetical protein
VTATEDQVLRAFRARLGQDPKVPAELRAAFDGTEWPDDSSLKRKIVEVSTSATSKDASES